MTPDFHIARALLALVAVGLAGRLVRLAALGLGRRRALARRAAESQASLAGRLETALAEHRERRRQAALGWQGFREFVVVRKEIEAAGVASLTLAPVDETELPAGRPGQSVAVRLVAGGEPLEGSCLLTAVPDGRRFRIAVGEVAGDRVGPILVDAVHPGDRLEVACPGGSSPLPDPVARGRSTSGGLRSVAGRGIVG